MRKGLAILAVTLTVGTLGSGLLLKTAVEWGAAQIFPTPWADGVVRSYLDAVQAGDWAAANARVRSSPGDDSAELIRTRWTACTARHGPIVGYEAHSKFLDPTMVEAKVRFADGTVSAWDLFLLPRDRWRLPEVTPPACAAQP